jgi:hypothetical protein
LSDWQPCALFRQVFLQHRPAIPALCQSRAVTTRNGRLFAPSISSFLHKIGSSVYVMSYWVPQTLLGLCWRVPISVNSLRIQTQLQARVRTRSRYPPQTSYAPAPPTCIVLHVTEGRMLVSSLVVQSACNRIEFRFRSAAITDGWSYDSCITGRCRTSLARTVRSIADTAHRIATTND